MDRRSIFNGLMQSDDVSSLFLLTAFARGRATDDVATTQRVLVRLLLGDDVEDQLLHLRVDDSIDDEQFGSLLITVTEARFMGSDDPSPLLHWWLLLAAIDLVGMERITLQRFIEKAEIVLDGFKSRAETSFSNGDHEKGMSWTYCEGVVVFETLRAVSKLKTDEAADFLWSVYNRSSLQSRQWRIPIGSALTALGAMGTEQALSYLTRASEREGHEFVSYARSVIQYAGQGSYDQIDKWAEQYRSKSNKKVSGCASVLVLLLCFIIICYYV